MDITREDRIRMERAHVRAWPALRTADIDGWLWRSSGGGSQRANSVSTIDFRGGSAGDAIDAVEAGYRAVDLPVRFQTFDETSPPELPYLLRERGYRQGDPTTTMFKRIASTALSADIDVRDVAWEVWRQVYLNAITESRRAVNAIILDRIPGPCAFFGCRRNGEIVATALCVVSFGCAVIECVATRSDLRRSGAARAVLAALEHWASGQDVDWIGLQVVASNEPAIALYRSLGFVAGSTNLYWVR